MLNRRSRSGWWYSSTRAKVASVGQAPGRSRGRAARSRRCGDPGGKVGRDRREPKRSSLSGTSEDRDARAKLRRVDPDRYVRPIDPELRLIGTVSTLAQRRHDGRSPRRVRSGNQVFHIRSELQRTSGRPRRVAPKGRFVACAGGCGAGCEPAD